MTGRRLDDAGRPQCPDGPRPPGRLIAVDCQRFGPENRGTYSLGGAAEVAAAPWKADMARKALPRFDVIPFRRPVSELPAAVDGADVPWFPIVLTALDTGGGAARCPAAVARPAHRRRNWRHHAGNPQP